MFKKIIVHILGVIIKIVMVKLYVLYSLIHSILGCFFFLWYLGCSDSLTYTQLIDIRLKKPAECSFPLLIQHDRCQSSEKRLCFRKCLNYTALLLHASKFFFNKQKLSEIERCLVWWFYGGKHCL